MIPRVMTILCMLVCLPCLAGDPPKSDLPFLSTDTAYVIEFVTLPSVFRDYPRSRTIEPNAGPLHKVTVTDTSRTDTLRLVKVTELGPGSWVQLEYPVSAADWPKWRGALRMTSRLTKDTMKTLGTDEPAHKYLTALKQTSIDQLARLKTTTIWVNLVHAVSIAPVDKDLREIKNLLDRRASPAK